MVTYSLSCIILQLLPWQDNATLSVTIFRVSSACSALCHNSETLISDTELLLSGDCEESASHWRLQITLSEKNAAFIFSSEWTDWSGLQSNKFKDAWRKKKWRLRLVWGWTRRWEIQIPDPWTTKYCNTVNLLQAENQYKYLPKKQTKTQAWMRKFLYSWNIYLVFFNMARLIS